MLQGILRTVGASATGMLSLVPKILRRWGVRGVLRILRSERVFASNHLGYVLVVGFKR